MSTNSFRAAVEAADLDALPALLAEDVTFLSPVAFRPYEGRAMVAAILRGAFRVFEDFRYVRELDGDGGRSHALEFKAKVDGRDAHGCDFLTYDDEGLITEFMVMMRPLSAANAMAEQMSIQFERIKQEVLAG
ncbi:MAG: nuclear transport factor 2 family protein [Solirubrobacteraceae bacterium]|nr:nuclear transport factor 2 family protein [Patulibacter sp.]